MKKIIGMFAMALCLAGCGGPDKVAVNFFEAIRDGEFDKAAEYAAKDTKPLVMLMSQMPDEQKKELEGTKFKAVETKIDGDTAKVKIEQTKDGKTETNDVDLVKEDGDWKVKIKKD